MLYWLLDLRYLEIACELLHTRYVNLKFKHDQHNERWGGPHNRVTEEYIDLHLRQNLFSPNVRQQKREENGENGVRTRGLY